MKKQGFFMLCMVILMLLSSMTFIAGCENDTPENTAPKEYTIQYTDDSGTHQITVTAGMPYSLDVVPEKTGYTFAGLFDAEVGGTQYISSTGASLSPFTDGKNMVLFPQFKAKDYTVILDYQGTTVTGSRQLIVSYGSSLPELPKSLTGEHKVFAGWYTKANCEGTQIADEYGLIPLVSVLNDTNFDLSGTAITLYAGFEIEKFTVTCCFEAGMDTEDVQVEYDTPVSQIVPKTRVDGKAPLTWSKTQGGEVFNGKVTDDMVLYAVEYAPVIELDSNGGSKVNAVVARAGATISLPMPTKDMAKFAYWEDMQGNRYTSTTMPSKSISLKAVWQAKIVFDSNGGTEVNDISVAAGNSIALPMPVREGFIFAGWYTTDKEQYTSTTMPSNGIRLKAGWHKTKTEKVHSIVGYEAWAQHTSVTFNNSKNIKFDLSGIIQSGQKTRIRMQFHVSLKQSWSGHFYTFCVNFYSKQQVSDAYFLSKKTFENISSTYQTFDFTQDFELSEPEIFYVWYISGGYNNFHEMYVKDFYADIIFPDTANLYL